MEGYIEIDLNTLPSTSVRRLKGVYFLYRGLKLVYIGSSANIVQRIVNHTKDKEFDSYKFIEINGNINILEVESGFIKKYQPEYNYIHTLKPNKKLSKIEEFEFNILNKT